MVKGVGAIFAENLQPWIRAFFSISLTTNILATGKFILKVSISASLAEPLLLPEHDRPVLMLKHSQFIPGSSHRRPYHLVEPSCQALPRRRRRNFALGGGRDAYPVRGDLFRRPRFSPRHVPRKFECAVRGSGYPATAYRKSAHYILSLAVPRLPLFFGVITVGRRVHAHHHPRRSRLHDE